MRVVLRLLAAALPPVLASLAIVQWAGAGPAIAQQQLAMGIVAALLSVASALAARRGGAWLRLVPAITPLLLAAPVWLTTSDAPERWVRVRGVGLYVSAAVLPAAVLLLAHALGATPHGAGRPVAIAVATAVALAVQPDAPQLTAFAAALAVASWRTGVTAAPRRVTLAALVTTAVAAWMQPDPLLPVPHVEGTMQVAAAAGPLALLLAIAAVACPPAMLVWLGRGAHGRPLLAVAAYYVVIDALAAAQWTPMPLLGFGAGPILGYALVAALAATLDDARGGPATSPSRTDSPASGW